MKLRLPNERIRRNGCGETRKKRPTGFGNHLLVPATTTERQLFYDLGTFTYYQQKKRITQETAGILTENRIKNIVFGRVNVCFI